jgi:steroid 5-alpha reductase family enzyme
MKYYILLASAIFLYACIWFGISILKKRNDVADIAWGLGFVVLAWLAFFLSESHPRALLVNALVTVWGLRLSWHIYKRNAGKPEDFRYLQWRNEWKNFYVRSFLQVFLLQGFFLYLTILPVLFINHAAFTGFLVLDALGVTLWLFGFYFESVGDYQLKQFKNNPGNKGKIIDTGLWRYTRHPNYFGEVVQWWGIFLLALAIPGGWWTIIGPITITYLVRYVSGVPMLERKYKGNPLFETYAAKTSIFFPLPPRSQA